MGGKRYCGDRDALSWKCCGVSGTRTECEMWGLCVLGGGGGRRYCGDRAGATVNFFGAGEESAGVRCAAGLGGTSFGGKSSCGERVAAGTKIWVQGNLSVELLGVFANGVGVMEVESEWWRRKAVRNFSAAGERQSELAGGAGLAGGRF